MKIKAAILEKLNSPLIVDDIEMPKLDVGQVLVEVRSSGICGAQLGEIAGAAGHDPYLPHLLGHEGAGIVAETGPGVRYIHLQDHVVMHWRKGVGIQAQFPKYKWGNKVVGGGSITTFNEYAVVSENRLTSIPFDIPFDVAALMGCSITTGLGVINNEAKLKIGQSIAVAGCGGVGLNVIQGAAMVGAHPIIAIDIHDEKLEKAKEFGATHIINSGILTKERFFEAVFKVVDFVGSNVFVDCTGSIDMIARGFSLISPGGKAILVGQPFRDQDLILPNMRQNYKGKVMMDSQGGLTDPTVDIPRYLELYRVGKLSVINTSLYPLDQINEAIDIMRSGQVVKGMVYMK